MPNNILFRVSLQKIGMNEGALPYIYNITPADLSLKVMFAVCGNERGNGGMIAGGLVFARTREIICVRGKLS